MKKLFCLLTALVLALTAFSALAEELVEAKLEEYESLAGYWMHMNEDDTWESLYLYDGSNEEYVENMEGFGYLMTMPLGEGVPVQLYMPTADTEANYLLALGAEDVLAKVLVDDEKPDQLTLVYEDGSDEVFDRDYDYGDDLYAHKNGLTIRYGADCWAVTENEDGTVELERTDDDLAGLCKVTITWQEGADLKELAESIAAEHSADGAGLSYGAYDFGDDQGAIIDYTETLDGTKFYMTDMLVVAEGGCYVVEAAEPDLGNEDDQTMVSDAVGTVLGSIRVK